MRSGNENSASYELSFQKRKENIMLKKLKILLFLIIGITLLQCSKNPLSTNKDKEIPIDLASAEKRLVESDNKFGLKLFREIVKEEKDKNVFISPLSVSMALGMTYNGANGKTQEAMQKTLELNGLTLQEVNECYKHLIETLTQLDPKVRFQIANSIWYRQDLTFEQEFFNLCQKYFDALVKALNFDDPNAAGTINAWVDEKTNGRIKEIVDSPIDPSLVMFLIDAIHFKGIWTYQFDPELTEDAWFYLPNGSIKICKLMAQRNLCQNFSNDVFRAIDLPYGDGDFSMTIFLPRGEIDIDSLIAKFEPDSFNYWLSRFTLSEDSFNIYIPKFKLEYGVKLSEALKGLGMGIAFTPGQADFTKMYKPGGTWISEVKHKTFVEMNEEGTEAAAVTSVGMSYGPNPYDFIVNRPFVFVIRENQSQTILFIGKIVEPTL
jgi:serine protease inhibitor